ncbi:DapH/DapD/GlmU-related protein [Spiroplasma endosymbiont of Stenodema calcarata]|uniref:DapH/DapD/GlmU-related protein n=1 Tax=Spiroplasma endosymbiont of Stenodema calcarata TaxID=3139328 RepID=UPI003CCB5615
MTKKEYITYIRTNNEPFDVSTNQHKMLWDISYRAIKVLAKLNQQSNPKRIHKLFCKLTDKKIDPSFILFPPFNSECGVNITIGENVFINKNCNFQDRGGIEINNDSFIGMNVTIATLNHGIDANKRQIIIPKKVIIGKNVWIGSGVTIIPGVTIGDNSIIAVGAVVTKNVETNSVYAGVPAHKIKDI